MRVTPLIAASLLLVSAAAEARTPAHVQLPGAWSFDGSCASGFGMTLRPDGKASYDEWGEGLWAAADNESRIVIIAEDITEEADRRKVAELIEFRVVAAMNDKLSLVRMSDGAKLEAVKCPSN